MLPPFQNRNFAVFCFFVFPPLELSVIFTFFKVFYKFLTAEAFPQQRKLNLQENCVFRKIITKIKVNSAMKHVLIYKKYIKIRKNTKNTKKLRVMVAVLQICPKKHVFEKNMLQIISISPWLPNFYFYEISLFLCS